MVIMVATKNMKNENGSLNWPAPADAAQTALGLERWRESVPPEFVPFAETDCGHRALAALFGNSPYLSRLACRYPEIVSTALADDPGSAIASVLNTLTDDLPPSTSQQTIMSGLRRRKGQVALAVALGDLSGIWRLETVVGTLSRFAELAIRVAVDHLLAGLADRGILTLGPEEDPAAGTGFFVLGMGKLGAMELNYSSDIDLILLYDPDAPGVRDADRLPMAMNRLARDLVRILEERTRDGYVFRTDLRLRPDPGATPPAVSVPAAENYYASLAQTWERSAMIKARIVAGDAATGTRFLEYLESFIWPKILDFTALADMVGVKRRIHQAKGHAAIALAGHDVKLGRGGIREVEFFAQVQQLLYGGRRRDLRVRPTLEALRRLTDAGYVRLDEREALARAYRFLRKVEHRLQMVNDQQTQTLPSSQEKLASFAIFMGYPSTEAFAVDLDKILRSVAQAFDTLFANASIHEAQPEPDGSSDAPLLSLGGVDDDPESLKVLLTLGFSEPTQTLQLIRGWMSGRYPALRSEASRRRLRSVAPRLLSAFGKTPEPQNAMTRMDGFLSKLPSGAQLFALVQANPQIAELLADIMGTAPALAEHLTKNPMLLDGVLTPGFFDRLPDIASLQAEVMRDTTGIDSFEAHLEAIVRFVEDERFRGGLHLLRGTALGEETGPFFSALAELAIRTLLPRVLDSFSERHGRVEGGEIAVLAMGKLGGRETSPGSDLDLILIYDHPDSVTQSDGPKPLPPTQYYTKLTQRLIGALTAQTPQGRLYEVDMRLRPSGNAGPVATRLRAFRTYQAEEAWTWEHMALTRSRVICGPRTLTLDIIGATRSILSTPRDHEALKTAILNMRRKIAETHRPTGPLDVKYRPGGLVDIEFTAQYLLLREADRLPDILSPSTEIALSNLVRNKFLSVDDAAPLIAAHRLWQRLQAFLRLTRPDLTGTAPLPLSLREGLVRACFPTLPMDAKDSDIHHKVEATAQAASHTVARIFGEPLSRPM